LGSFNIEAPAAEEENKEIEGISLTEHRVIFFLNMRNNFFRARK
jgi:hypothetical protein